MAGIGNPSPSAWRFNVAPKLRFYLPVSSIAMILLSGNVADNRVRCWPVDR